MESSTVTVRVDDLQHVLDWADHAASWMEQQGVSTWPEGHRGESYTRLRLEVDAQTEEPEFDPDACEECHDRPKLDEGTYPDLCGECGYIAFKEDEADRKRDDF